MTTSSPKDVTRLLQAWSDGDRTALEELTRLVHDELHRLAHSYMLRERAGHTLQSSALINEAYLRLIQWKGVRWKNRAHFFAVAAGMMRRILVDYARSRGYLKRGGLARRVSVDEVAIVSKEPCHDLLVLEEALQRLERVDPRKSRTVELRYFAGLTVEETAEVLKVSPRTVMRHWSLARAWLYRELTGDGRNEA